MYAKRRAWAKLALDPETCLRQSFTDETYMREHLKAAGIRVADSNEPATVPRLRSFLRKVGMTAEDHQEALGTDLAGFLRLNPKLPLWAAVALVLESSGRFGVPWRDCLNEVSLRFRPLPLPSSHWLTHDPAGALVLHQRRRRD